MTLFKKKLLWILLGNAWKTLSYFKFQHLVTLALKNAGE